jgi:hypothetical protein
MLSMKYYTCEDCGKDFNQKCHFVNHINRIKSCKEIPNKTTYKCINCNSLFFRKDNLHRHRKTCKSEFNTNILQNTKNEIIENINNIFNKNIGEIPNTDKNNEKQIINNTHNGDINVTNNIQVNVYVNNYTDSKLECSELKLILNNDEPIFEGVKHIFCNENKPENHNVLVTDKSRNTVAVYENEKWTNKDKNHLYRVLFGQVMKQIDELIIKNNNLDIDRNKVNVVFFDDDTNNNGDEITYNGNDLTDFNDEKKYFLNPSNIKKYKSRLNNVFYNANEMVANTKIKNDKFIKNYKNLNKIIMKI